MKRSATIKIGIFGAPRSGQAEELARLVEALLAPRGLNARFIANGEPSARWRADAAVIFPQEGRLPDDLLQLAPRRANTPFLLCVADGMDAPAIVKLANSGARFISYPFAAEEIAGACAALLESDSRRGTIIAVIGAKGGVGASFFTAGLAATIASSRPAEAQQAAGGKVCAIDLVPCGDLARYLGASCRYSTADALSRCEELDGEILANMLSRVDLSEGADLFVLGADEVFSTGRAEEAVALLEAAAANFDHVICELPPIEPLLAALAEAETLVLVVDQSLAAVKRARALLDRLRSDEKLGFLKIASVVNRARRRDDNPLLGLFPSPEEIAERLDLKCIALFPEDFPAVARCIAENRLHKPPFAAEFGRAASFVMTGAPEDATARNPKRLGLKRRIKLWSGRR